MTGLDDWAGLAAFAERLAETARPIARRWFRQRLTIDTKSDLSPVTAADREIEAVLRHMIEAEHPDHGILGEEEGVQRGDARLVWVIDPIDGTKAFITGMPLFGTLIALVEDGAPRLGVIEAAAMGERWTGAPGHPTRLNGVPTATSGCADLGAARLYATSPDMFGGALRTGFERLAASVRIKRFGGDCYAYGLVASGHVDLVVEADLQPYDYLPLVAVVEGAGGVITDWSGRPLRLGSDGRVVAAASRALLDQALDKLNG